MSDTPRVPPAATPILPFEQLRDTGLLWLINTALLHPRGYALAILHDDEGHATSWQLLGDGTERWSFPDSMNDELDARFKAVQRILK